MKTQIVLKAVLVISLIFLMGCTFHYWPSEYSVGMKYKLTDLPVEPHKRDVLVVSADNFKE